MFNIRYSASFMALMLLLTACQSASVVEPTTTIAPDSTTESSTVPPIALEPEVAYEPNPYTNSQLYLDNIQSGGVPLDGIPSVDVPLFISINEAKSLYNDLDQMFVVTLDDQVYLYPQSILVWHEIVNMSKHNAAVTYCPLTGSGITYLYPDHITTEFGTSGNLLNSNLVMYDRATGSNISQIDGVGLDGPLQGYVLETIPTHWVNFGHAANLYATALVLSEQTGYLRDYTRDPYGSYTKEVANSYYTSSGVMFPLLHTPEDQSIHEKQPIIGLKSNGLTLALHKSSVIEGEALNFNLGKESFTAVYDAAIDNVHIFNGTLTIQDNMLVDNKQDLWSLDGIMTNTNERLTSPLYFEVMWFAWYAFYPETEVI